MMCKTVKIEKGTVLNSLSRGELISLIQQQESTIDKQATETERLKEALQALYDEQNGPPLIREEAEWNAAMRLAEECLRKDGE